MVAFFCFFLADMVRQKKKKGAMNSYCSAVMIEVVRVGYFFLFSWPSIYVSYWFTVICEILTNGKFYFSVNRDLDFFYFLRFGSETPAHLLFFKFSSMEKVFKIDLHLQTFFSSIFICILAGIRLSCLPLNCHYHQIGFALKQVVPVSY